MHVHQFCISLVLLVGLTCCQKKEPAPQTCGGGLQPATVVRGLNACGQNGFVLRLNDGATYPPDALPGDFQQEGLEVCLAYTTYEDLRLCACCGGTRLKIQQIRRR